MYETRQIIRESLPVMIAMSMIGLCAGLILTSIEELLYTTPFLLTVIPAMNGMIGNFSCVIASKTSTFFRMGNQKRVKIMFLNSFFVAAITSTYLLLAGWLMNPGIRLWKAAALVYGTSAVLITFICIMVYFLTIYFLKRNKDPDNAIIPIATSVADALSVLTFSLLIKAII